MAQVTDPALLKELAREGINPAEVDFDQDYAPHSRGKRHSPYAKFYRGLSGNARGKQWAVISGLPMVDADGVLCEPKWVQTGNTYYTKANVFDGLVNDIPGRVTLTVKNDDPVGRLKNDRLVYIPQLFLNGIEVPRPGSVLLPVDPLNSNYLENTIEWDYGICKRRLRQIEGHILGSWVFPANPGGEVRIVYNQTGQYRLKLGQYATDADTEVIPASAFITDEFGKPRQYPFTVSDSATYYPDPTTTVDGTGTSTSASVWATLVADAGVNYQYTTAESVFTRYITHASISDRYNDILRGIFLFDTSGLPDDATISAGVLSLYGTHKGDQAGTTPTIVIDSSNPASNTIIGNGDYATVGHAAEVGLSAAITYAGYSTTGYNDFTLNANGLAAISKTGISKFGARFGSYDYTGATPPTWGADKVDWFQGYFSEQGNGYKPKLVVTYTSTIQGKASLNAAKLMAAGAI